MNTFKKAQNFMIAAAQLGIEMHEAAELIQDKHDLSSDQWDKLLQLWECETALAEED